MAVPDMPDIVCETDAGTYCGRFDRARADRSKPLQEQEIWQIQFIRRTEPGGTTVITENLYPDGRKKYDFAWAKLTEYNYDFAF